MPETRAYLTLKHTRGLGARKIKLLVDALGSARAVLAADNMALSSVEGVGPSLIKALDEAKQSDWPDKEIERAHKLKTQLIHLEHPDYPACLKAIYDPPSLLYVRGELPKFKGMTPKSLGIVGTRNASDQALHFTKDLAEALAASSVVVVSGLALGIDTAAHQGSMLKGKTVAVLGSGVDYIYPAQNRNLAMKIIEGNGAVISEYPLGTRPNPTNFPGRNRIINGLSRGVIVVEAGQKSGALITADYAANEGRIVFAVPGRPGDPRSSGSLALLKQGAILVDQVDDILNEFNWRGSQENKLSLDLNPDERRLVKAILDLDNPVLDNLATQLNQSATTLLPSLTMLELKGAIKLSAGGRYLAVVSLDS